MIVPRIAPGSTGAPFPPVRWSWSGAILGTPFTRPRAPSKPSVLILLVPTIRLERMTYRLQGGCSTN
jgi:hypothetical protein